MIQYFQCPVNFFVGQFYKKNSLLVLFSKKHKIFTFLFLFQPMSVSET